MDQNKHIGIVVPSFNGSSTIRDAIGSMRQDRMKEKRLKEVDLRAQINIMRTNPRLVQSPVAANLIFAQCFRPVHPIPTGC